MTRNPRLALLTALALCAAGSISAAAPLIATAQTAVPSHGLASGLSVDPSQATPAGAVVLTSADYPPAVWVPAAATNFSVASRDDDYPIQLIVIHDIEGSAGSAIKTFQDPNRHGSAHYIVSFKGQVWQMVDEKDIAWHAGNWDVNTRAIGIEHEGFAWTPGLYTPTEYRASARLAASICSRWGVPMDRTHVIGHSQVPDPYHPGLFGGAEHHTDPGPYWDWTYYMGYARYYASLLPSPPHMVVDAVAVPWDQSATVTWLPAQTCHNPVTSYHVVLQPGGIVQDLPGDATTATFGGLQDGTSYSFTVTAINSDGQSARQSNSVIAGPHCTSAGISTGLTSPQFLGTQIQFSATSAGCPNPRYSFSLRYPSGTWVPQRGYGGSASWNWDTSLLKAGTYTVRAGANQSGDFGNPEAFTDVTFSLTEPPPCTSASLSPSKASQPAGSTVSFTTSASGCPIALYEYWVQYPSGTWSMFRSFSTNSAWNWNTTGFAPGKYTIHVWANHPGHSTSSFEVYGSSTVTLTGCTSATLSPASGASRVGTPIAFTATSRGCPNPVYEFWVQDTRGIWHMMRGFGGNTWTWNDAGWGKGVYHIHVWANQQGSYTGRLQAVGSSTRTLT